MQELPVVTGLAMGELRTINEIKAADKKVSRTGSWRENLPFNIGPWWGPSGSDNALPDTL